MLGRLTISRYHYRISGLNVSSGVELPMMAQPESDVPVDVWIDVGAVPERLDHVTHRGANWSVCRDGFLLDLPGIGRFLSAEGRRITLSPAPGMLVDDIRVFATGSALGAILYQRGALLLHGSAVIRDGRAFVFCGSSGAGKSTLAAALSRSGDAFLADDVCAIELAHDGSPLIHPDGRELRLYADSIGKIGLRDAIGRKVRSQVEKFHVGPPLRSTEGIDGVPLAAIYMLADSNAAAPPGITALPHLAAAQALLRQTYRRRLALAYCSEGHLVTRTAALLSHAQVFDLHRPRDFALLDDTLARLRDHWDGRA